VKVSTIYNNVNAVDRADSLRLACIYFRWDSRTKRDSKRGLHSFPHFVCITA